SPRQGTITVAGLSFTIIQDSKIGPDCTHNLFPTFQSHPATGGVGSFSVVTDQRCAWQAVSNAGWIRINSNWCGIGNGHVDYSGVPNPTTTGRVGTITVSGRNFSVKQKGSNAPDTSPPTTPGNVTATPLSPTQIDISWNASVDNLGVAGYRVFRNG